MKSLKSIFQPGDLLRNSLEDECDIILLVLNFNEEYEEYKGYTCLCILSRDYTGKGKKYQDFYMPKESSITRLSKGYIDQWYEKVY